jgi:hypothetical protein
MLSTSSVYCACAACSRTVEKAEDETAALQARIRKLGAGTVAVYTVVTPDRYWAIVIAPDVMVAREYLITSKDLRRKAFALTEDLRNRHSSPLVGARKHLAAQVREGDWARRKADLRMGPCRHCAVQADCFRVGPRSGRSAIFQSAAMRGRAFSRMPSFAPFWRICQNTFTISPCAYRKLRPD